MNKNDKKKRGRPMKNNCCNNMIDEDGDIIFFLPLLNKCMIDDKIISNDISNIDNDMYAKLTIKDNEMCEDTLEQYLNIKSGKPNCDTNNTNINTEIKTMNGAKYKINIIGDISENHEKKLSCWWCTFEFNNEPCYLPDKLQYDTYHVFGIFCSFNCCMAYNMNLNDNKVFHRLSLIYSIYDILNGDSEELMHIHISPPKELLKKYGGNLEIEEYRNNFNTIHEKHNILMPPLCHIQICVESVTQSF